jgi:hypothetical protein
MTKQINMKKTILFLLFISFSIITFSQSKIPSELPKKSDIVKLYTKQDKSKYFNYFLEKLQENSFEIEKKDDSFGSYSTGFKVIDYYNGVVSYRIYGYIKQIQDTSVLVLQGQVKSSVLGLTGMFQSKLEGGRTNVSRYSFNEILSFIEKLEFDRLEIYPTNNN